MTTIENCDYSAIINDEPNIENVVNSIAKCELYDKYETKTKFHSIAEQGFLGKTCEVNIKNSDGREINVFMKILNTVNTTSFVKVHDVYAKELFVYRDLANVYEKLQEEFDVPQAERYTFVKSYADSSPTMIILDNMTKKGYKTYHRSAIMSLEFAVLAVKELAKFHALSFALKEKRSKYFEENVATINHPYIFNEDWTHFINTFVDITKKHVHGDVRRKLDLFNASFVERYKKFLEEDKFKLCLCHGDYRPGNILTKEINGKVTDVIPIDYQLIYYGCPVMDLLYFIYTSLDKKMRINVPYLKDVYHNTLNTFLNYFKIDVEKVFPREEFEVMFKERLTYGLKIALLISPILTLPDDDICDLATLTSVGPNSDDDCQERMTDVLNEFIEWGLL